MATVPTRPPPPQGAPAPSTGLPLPPASRVPMTSPVKPSGTIEWAGRIQDSTDDEGAPKISIALTSRESGEGKSESAASFPKPLVLLADANDGLLKARNIPYIPIGSTEGFKQFLTEIIPALYHRDPYFDRFETIVLDSFSHLQPFLLGSIEMGTTGGGEEDTQRWYGNAKTRGLDVLRQFTHICKPYAADPTRPKWNVVVTCHLQEVYTKTKDRNATPVIEKFVPMIEGAVRNLFYGYFNTALVLQKGRFVGPGNVMMTKYKAHTESPDGNRFITKETLGGNDKKWNALPAEMDITNKSLYEVLASHWGFPPKGDDTNPK